MTLAVADTSPLNYLVLIGEVDVLPRLFARVLIPDVVAGELRDPDAPLPVLEWVAHPPSWIEICPTPVSPERFERLDEGERAAILLALAQFSAVTLLIDDADGRAEADRRGIPTTGTLGVLRAAAVLGLIDLPAALGRLGATSFRSPAAVVDQLLSEDCQRKRG